MDMGECIVWNESQSARSSRSGDRGHACHLTTGTMHDSPSPLYAPALPTRPYSHHLAAHNARHDKPPGLVERVHRVSSLSMPHDREQL